MSNVFHLVVTVDYVDTRVDQSQVGTQLHVACIEHIGEQGQVSFVVESSAISIRCCNCSRAAIISCRWVSGEAFFFSFNA